MYVIAKNPKSASKYKVYLGHLKAIEFAINKSHGMSQGQIVGSIAKHLRNSNKLNHLSIGTGRLPESLGEGMIRAWTNEIKSRGDLCQTDCHAAELSVPDCWRRLSYSIEQLANPALVLLRRTDTIPSSHTRTLRLLASLAMELGVSLFPEPWSFWLNPGSGEICEALISVGKAPKPKSTTRPTPETHLLYWPRLLRHASDSRAATDRLTIFNYIYALRLRNDYATRSTDYMLYGSADRAWKDHHAESREPILKLYVGTMAIFESVIVSALGSAFVERQLNSFRSEHVTFDQRKIVDAVIATRIESIASVLTR